MIRRDMMKAIILEKTCKADDLKVSTSSIPSPTPGMLVIKIRGFGINRSEVILRDYEADEEYINLPVIPGIECYGEVIDCGDTSFDNGDLVFALMGGMGRSFDGSYAEYTLVPEHHVFKISDEMIKHYNNEELASLPETYYTAYGSLFNSLNLQEEEIILIRGATSALGLASIQLAKAMGCTIISTTRKKERINKLLSYGSDYVIIDDGTVSDKILELYPEGLDKVLELVGPITMEDSMKCVKIHGVLCITGILGGEEVFSNFNPMKYVPNGKYLTSFHSNNPTREDFDNIYELLIENDIKPCISQIYSLEEISEAHKLMESNEAFGKIVIMNQEEYDDN